MSTKYLFVLLSTLIIFINYPTKVKAGFCGEGGELRVISQNIETGHNSSQLDRYAQYIVSNDVDIILWTEGGETAGKRDVRRLTDKLNSMLIPHQYTYRSEKYTNGADSMDIITHCIVLDYSASGLNGRVLNQMLIDTSFGPIRFFNIHNAIGQDQCNSSPLVQSNTLNHVIPFVNSFKGSNKVLSGDIQLQPFFDITHGTPPDSRYEYCHNWYTQNFETGCNPTQGSSRQANCERTRDASLTDFIFIHKSSGLRVKEYVIDQDFDSLFPSDHYLILASLEVAPVVPTPSPSPTLPTPTVNPSPAQSCPKCDTNLDGEVTVLDVITVIRYIFR